MQSAKNQESQFRGVQRFRAPRSTCTTRALRTQRSGVVAETVAVETVVAPVPPAAVPAQGAGAQAATAVAVDGAPEEDVAGVALPIPFPLLRNEVRVLQEVVEDVGVQHGLLRQLLAELIALDVLPVLLAAREIELHLRGVPLQRSALLVFLHRPSVFFPRIERVGVAVNDVLDDVDGRVAAKDAAHVREDVALAKTLDVVVAEVRTSERQLEFVGLANIEHQIVAHRCTPCCDGVLTNRVACQRAPSS